MSLLTKFKQPEIQPLEPETLDQLWHEACQLGGIRVWQYSRSHSFDVTIAFTTRSGSDVEAKGSHTDVHIALSRAINEARSLGAG